MCGMSGTALRRSQLIHLRRVTRLRRVARLTLVITSVLGLIVSQAMAQEVAAEDARGALDEYVRAWNAADNEAIAQVSNFPRVSIGLNGQIVVRQSPEEIETDFDLLRQAEGWDHTTLDLVEAVHTSDDKVHFKVVSSRRRADGTAYRTGPSLYIFTRQDGHWGLQIQSVLPPTFTAP